jgi:hypothetical protein
MLPSYSAGINLAIEGMEIVRSRHQGDIGERLLPGSLFLIANFSCADKADIDYRSYMTTRSLIVNVQAQGRSVRRCMACHFLEFQISSPGPLEPGNCQPM